MEVEPDPALFTSSGHARAGYSPFPPNINRNEHNISLVDHHTVAITLHRHHSIDSAYGAAHELCVPSPNLT